MNFIYAMIIIILILATMFCLIMDKRKTDERIEDLQIELNKAKFDIYNYSRLLLTRIEFVEKEICRKANTKEIDNLTFQEFAEFYFDDKPIKRNKEAEIKTKKK